MERQYSLFFVLNTLFIIFALAFSDDNPVPGDKAQLEGWFTKNVKPLADRKTTLDPALVAAEAVPPKIIRVHKDGTGDFKTITDAVKSIPAKNDKRIIVSIGAGEYFEKVKLEADKPFVTLYGNPKAMPTLVFNGTKCVYNILNCGTLVVEGDYFVAANLHIRNSAPMPNDKTKDGQASAMRISGDKATFYNVRFYGFQDTFYDDKGKHFFKDCYIEGTVDYIFGQGTSLYLNCEIFPIKIPNDPEQWITAQGRDPPNVDCGFVFLHSSVTGTSNKKAMLGRAWKTHAKVIFAYSVLSNSVHPLGWSSNGIDEKTLYLGEYKNKGPGADLAKRAPFTKKITPEEIVPYIRLSYIDAYKWLLPPPVV